MLSVVIPSHHRVDLLAVCLASVFQHAAKRLEVIVVDDASPSGVVAAAAARFPGVIVHRRPRQEGFAAAANSGIRLSTGEVVQLLNDDTEVTPGWDGEAIRHFEDSHVGAVAPLVL